MADTRPGWSMVSALAAVGLAMMAVAVSAMPMPGGGTPAHDAFAVTQDDVFDIGNGVTSPRVTHDVRPDYTQAAKDAKIQGVVIMSAVVRRDGTVGDVRVTTSLDAKLGLDDAAVAALRQWTFEPGRRNGEPVAVRVTVEMRFTLK